MFYCNLDNTHLINTKDVRCFNKRFFHGHGAPSVWELRIEYWDGTLVSFECATEEECNQEFKELARVLNAKNMEANL